MRRELVPALPTHVTLVATRPLIWTFGVAWTATPLTAIAVFTLRMVVTPVSTSVPTVDFVSTFEFIPTVESVPASIALVGPLWHSAATIVFPFRGSVTRPVIYTVSWSVARPVGILWAVAVVAISATFWAIVVVRARIVIRTGVAVLSVDLGIFAGLFGLLPHGGAVIASGLLRVTSIVRRVRLAFMTRWLWSVVGLLALTRRRISHICLRAGTGSRCRISWRFALRGFARSSRWLVLYLARLLSHLHNPLRLLFGRFVLWLGSRRVVAALVLCSAASGCFPIPVRWFGLGGPSSRFADDLSRLAVFALGAMAWLRRFVVTLSFCVLVWRSGSAFFVSVSARYAVLLPIFVVIR